jgi:hypothetical protein
LVLWWAVMRRSPRLQILGHQPSPYTNTLGLILTGLRILRVGTVGRHPGGSSDGFLSSLAARLDPLPKRLPTYLRPFDQQGEQEGSHLLPPPPPPPSPSPPRCAPPPQEAQQEEAHLSQEGAHPAPLQHHPSRSTHSPLNLLRHLPTLAPPPLHHLPTS